MLIGETNPKTQKRSLAIIIGVLVTVIVVIFILATQIDLGRIGFIQTKNTTTLPQSVAIYVLADVSMEAVPDLRTKFWEPQLQGRKLNVSVHYISDGDMTLGGKEWIVPPACSGENSDPGFCERNIESWNHFVQEHSDVSWYFKAGQETYLNIDNLLNLLAKLEKTINPMKDPYFQFALDETDNIIHPSGGSGWLISNAATTVLDANSQHFIYACEKSGEDIALGMLVNDMQLDVDSFESPYFIPMWPESVRDLAAVDAQMPTQVAVCPLSQFRFEDQIDSPFQKPADFIATRMAFTPMNEVPLILKKIPKETRIAYPSEQTPIFCYQHDDAQN